MSEHIYFRVGGPADILVTPVNEEQVVNTLKLCREYNVPYFNGRSHRPLVYAFG